jgi:hypothetical protein
MEEEMEQTLTFPQGSEDEHSAEMLKISSQEAEQEITAALESIIEEEVDSIDFVDLYQELQALERRVIVQSFHIQQAKLEEVGSMPVGEMTVAELPQEEVEKQFSEKTAELDFAVEYPLSATKRDKYGRGYWAYIPTEKIEVQQRRMETKSQPVEQLEEVIEEIIKLMSSSTE